MAKWRRCSPCLRPARARRWWSAMTKISMRFAGGALRFGFGPRADIRGEDIELGPASEAGFACGTCGSRCRCRARTMLPMRLPRSPPVVSLGVPLAEMVGPLAHFTGCRATLPDRRQGARRRSGRRFRPQCGQDRRRDQDGASFARRACSPSISHTVTGQPVSCAATSWRPSRESSGRTTVLTCSKSSMPAAPRSRDFSSADIVAEIAALGTNAEFAPSRDWLVGPNRTGSKARRSRSRNGRPRSFSQRACPCDACSY